MNDEQAAEGVCPECGSEMKLIPCVYKPPFYECPVCGETTHQR